MGISTPLYRERERENWKKVLPQSSVCGFFSAACISKSPLNFYLLISISCSIIWSVSPHSLLVSHCFNSFVGCSKPWDSAFLSCSSFKILWMDMAKTSSSCKSLKLIYFVPMPISIAPLRSFTSFLLKCLLLGVSIWSKKNMWMSSSTFLHFTHCSSPLFTFKALL